MSGRRLAFSTLGLAHGSVAEILALAAKHAIAGVELRSAAEGAIHTGLTADERRTIKAAFAEVGVTVVSVATYVGLCPVDSEVSLIDEILLAGDLGAGAIRVFMKDDSTPGGADPGPLTDGESRAIDRLEEVMDLSARSGVRVLVETHDQHSSASRLARFMQVLDRAVPGHTVGVIWDTAHPWGHGEELAHSFAALSRWLGYLQVKDEHTREDRQPCPLGAGRFPIEELVSLLDEAGWSGWASLEWENRWHPELSDLDAALSALRGWAPGLEVHPGTD